MLILIMFLVPALSACALLLLSGYMRRLEKCKEGKEKHVNAFLQRLQVILAVISVASIALLAAMLWIVWMIELQKA